jgi:rhodanese-related sulfurtransferase
MNPRLWCKSIAAVSAAIVLSVAADVTPSAQGDSQRVSAREIPHVDAAGAARLIEAKQVKILDVRTPAEYAAGHIKGATLIDFNDPRFRQKVEALDRKQPYLLHCRSGARSTQSLALFKELGFEAVTHLEGGILAWTKAGKPVEKEVQDRRARN